MAASEPVRWSDEVHSILTGDLTVAAAFTTPSGGAVVVGVAPCGLVDRDRGVLGFTTSLGLPRKLRRIADDPRVALAFHSRRHGFATSPAYVLAQGVARVDLTPSRPRLDAFVPQAERYVGPVKTGPVWDRLLREFYLERVFVDVSVVRLAAWPDLRASGTPDVAGLPLPEPPAPQAPTARGTAPRTSVRRLATTVQPWPNHLVAFGGSDGFPVVAPVRCVGHAADGLHLIGEAGVLPPGGRRAGFLAHTYRPQLVGVRTRFATGWLQVLDERRAVFAPHTVHGLDTPPVRELVLVLEGLTAKQGLRRARRSGLVEELAKVVRTTDDRLAGSAADDGAAQV